ncbi:hypothetical protein ACQ4PT_036112 [Festuca glaucescens]
MDKSQLSNSQMDHSNEINSQMDNSSFLDMLNVGGDTHWGGTPDSSPIGEQATMPTQNIPTSAKPKSTKGTSTKGKNWSSVEDKVLIQAWANTSLDAVTGTDQNSHSYWGRISYYYKAHKQQSWPERNANALNCHFGGISASTSKFCGYLQQIINKDESGRTIDDKKIDAEEMYIRLSLETVWAQKIEKDDTKEAAKNARYARAFELQEKQIALQEREDARKEREDARQEREAARIQFEAEEKIMLMDTSGMTIAQKQFYKNKQDEITARLHQTSG